MVQGGENAPFDESILMPREEDFVPVPGVPKPSSALEIPFETPEQRAAGFKDGFSPKSEVERFEAEGTEWIVDHTGIRRKPFKMMHREIKEILQDKVVVMHNLCKDFAYLRLTRHDCLRTLDTSLFKMF